MWGALSEPLTETVVFSLDLYSNTNNAGFKTILYILIALIIPTMEAMSPEFFLQFKYYDVFHTTFWRIHFLKCAVSHYCPILEKYYNAKTAIILFIFTLILSLSSDPRDGWDYWSILYEMVKKYII